MELNEQEAKICEDGALEKLIKDYRNLGIGCDGNKIILWDGLSDCLLDYRWPKGPEGSIIINKCDKHMLEIEKFGDIPLSITAKYK